MQTNLIKKSDNHPVSIFFRLRRRAQKILERHWPYQLISRVVSRGIESTVKNAAAINCRLNRFVSNVPFSKVDFPSLLSDAEREKLQKMADAFMHHRFDLLGSGPVNLGRKITWHRDSVTGFRWDPLLLYSEAYGVTPVGSDIKRPWELSRCQHFVSLGIAWQLSGQNKYRDEFVSEIEDWIAQNPVGFGVNWACPMDVAIRAINWLSGYALFCPGLSAAEFAVFRKNLTISLWEHGRFIKTHLEWNGPFSERRANHFLSNLSGLFTLGIFFSDTKPGARWLRFAQNQLEKEMQRQVLEDGVHFECSISYHRLCLEMFMWCYHLGLNNEVFFSSAYQKKLEKMRVFSCTYMRPDGTAPLIGDNDDGRLLFSGLGNINDHRYLCDATLKGACLSDAKLLWGSESFFRPAVYGISAFKKAGFYVFRYPDLYLIVRAGRLAHNGTHAHCDQLSFELCVKGFPVFVDRGTYVYTSDTERRNLYRSTRAHNVLTVNRTEQNRLSGPVFGLQNDTQSRILRVDEREIKIRHTGFKTLMRKDISHTRTFRLFETEWKEQRLEIFDEVDGVRNGDVVEWFFHLAPELETEFIEQGVIVKQGPETVCKMEFPAEMSLRKDRFEHSPSYGKLQEADTLIFSLRIDNSCSYCRARYLVLWLGKY